MRFFITTILALVIAFVTARPIDARAVNTTSAVSSLYYSKVQEQITMIPGRYSDTVVRVVPHGADDTNIDGDDDGQEKINDDMSNIVFFRVQGTFTRITVVFEDSHGNGLLGTLDKVGVGILSLVLGIVGLASGICELLGIVFFGALGAVFGVLGLLLQVLFGWAIPCST